jgi:hypothetical protein
MKMLVERERDVSVETDLDHRTQRTNHRRKQNLGTFANDDIARVSHEQREQFARRTNETRRLLSDDDANETKTENVFIEEKQGQGRKINK